MVVHPRSGWHAGHHSQLTARPQRTALRSGRASSAQGLLPDVVHDARHVGLALRPFIGAPQVAVGGDTDGSQQFIHHFAEVRIAAALGGRSRGVLGWFAHIANVGPAGECDKRSGSIASSHLVISKHTNGGGVQIIELSASCTPHKRHHRDQHDQ